MSRNSHQIKEIAWRKTKNGCHNCTSHIPGSNGYPCATRNGEYKKISRIVLEKKLGREILPGLFALHSCDNAMCINPDHLREGTHTENMKDKVLRGRIVSGKKHHASKITTLDASLIRSLYKTGHSQANIGKLFGLSQTNISQIIRNKTWKSQD